MITITNSNDSGPGSLRDAIESNGAPQSLDMFFDSSLSGLTITQLDTRYDLAGRITLNGDIDGDGTYDVTLFSERDEALFTSALDNTPC